MKKLLLLIGMCASIVFASAQRKTVSQDYTRRVWEIPYSQMPGKLNYGYIVDENGNHVKDGAYSIKCALTNYKYNYSIHTIVYNGSYSLTTTFKNGNLNGAFSTSYKLAVTGSSILGVDKGNISASMTGSFVNGVPNGAFNVTRNGELITKLTANYKNGKLVGAYSCSMLDEDARVQQYSGTLSQDGKFIGAWKFNDNAMTFSNGVLISKASKDRSTPPAVSAYAKKYAAGTITEEQLYKEAGCVVCVDSVKLGDFARIAVFRDAGVDFKDLGGYDFSEPNYIKYKYLKKLATMTDAGFAKLLEGIADYLSNHHSSMLSDISSSSTYDPNVKYGCILSGIDGRPYVYMHRSQNKGYAVGGFEEWYDDVYISETQMAQIDSEVEKIMIANATTLEECIYRQMSSYELAPIKAYFEGNKNGWNQEAERYFIYNIQKETDEAKKAAAMAEYNNETAKALQNIEKQLTKVYEIYCKDGEKHPTNNEYVIWKNCKDSSSSTYITRYITVASVEQFAAKLAQITKEIEECLKVACELRGTSANIAKDRAKAQKVEKIMPTIQFMKAEKKPLGMVYSESSKKYFYTTSNNEYWQLDFEKLLKPFCPILDIELVDIDDTNAVLKVKKQGKKKTIVTYQISLQYDNQGRFCAESFDINKATQITE